MYPERTLEPEIRAIGGEPLEGSGFESDAPETGLESYEAATEEGFIQ